jgi:hypothetical protein
MRLALVLVVAIIFDAAVAFADQRDDDSAAQSETHQSSGNRKTSGLTMEIVDSTGTEVGPILAFPGFAIFDGATDQAARADVALGIQGLIVAVEVTPTGIGGTIHNGGLFFESVDCSGTPLFAGGQPNSRNTLLAIPTTVTGPGNTFWIPDPDAPVVASVTEAHSQLTEPPNSHCASVLSGIGGPIAAISIGDVGASFAPPFRLVLHP